MVGVLSAADAVLCVSRDLGSKTVELGVSANKVHVWAQGVDVGLFHPGDRTAARRRLGQAEQGAVAVWVGRMVHVKGLDVLLEAAAVLRDRGVSLRIVLWETGLCAGHSRSVSPNCGSRR